MVLARLKNGLRRWRAREQAWQQLSRLNDRQLDDIGLSRNDIFAVVYGRDNARG